MKLVNEVDGLKIISNDGLYFLEPIDYDNVVKTFIKLENETSNASLILEAYSKYLKKDPVCFEMITDKKINLNDGIEKLIKIAQKECNKLDWVQHFLKAIGFAMSYLTDYDAKILAD